MASTTVSPQSECQFGNESASVDARVQPNDVGVSSRTTRERDSEPFASGVPRQLLHFDARHVAATASSNSGRDGKIVNDMMTRPRVREGTCDRSEGIGAKESKRRQKPSEDVDEDTEEPAAVAIWRGDTQ
jgi:hypothetical protein